MLKKSQYILIALLIICPYQGKAQSLSQENFLTKFIASIQYSGWYLNATAIGLALPLGIEQKSIGTIIPASEISPLGGWGYGWTGWLNNIIVSISINKRFYQVQQLTNGNILTKDASSVDFMLGYTVQRFDRIQIIPTIEYGLTGYPTHQSNPNPFWQLGASLGITYSFPFYSGYRAENGVWFDAGALFMFNLGYVQYFSVLDGSIAQSAVIARLRVGLGLGTQRMQSNSYFNQTTGANEP